MSHRWFLPLYLFIACHAIYSQEWIVDIDYAQDVYSQCVEQFPHNDRCLIESLSFSSDVYIQEDELIYLLGFDAQDRITRDQFVVGCEYIKKKKAFSRIAATFTTCGAGYNLHIHLYGQWTLGKIRFKGMLTGKDDYRHYYTINQGEPFEITQHRQSLASIRQAFKREGYCQAQIRDYLQYKVETKSVNVYIYMDPGNKFTIQELAVQIEETDQLSDFQCNELAIRLRKQSAPRLLKSKYSEALLNQEALYVKKYLEKKGYWESSISVKEVVDVDNNSVHLLFCIQLGEQRTFVFFGNHFFSSSQLRDEIMSFGRSAGIVPKSFLSEELVDCYHKKGFWDVQVHTHQQDDSLYFVINEGKRAKIKEVEIRGLEFFDGAALSKKFFRSCIRHRWYDYELLQKHKQLLLDFYQHEGFWDVTIVDQKIELISKNRYKVILTIDEGSQRMLSDISISEYPDLQEAWPYQLEEPIPFEIDSLQDQKYWIVNHFHKKGFSDVHVKPILEDTESGIHVIWKVYGADNCVRFGKTVIIGNQRFPFKHVVRELQYRHGQPWDRYDVEASMKKFRELNTFETVHMYPDSDEQDGGHAVLLRLIQDDPIEVRVRAGFFQVGKNLTLREGSSYKIGGSLLFKNPFNVGDHVLFNADVTRFFRNVSLLYYRPWIFNSPLHTLYKGYTNTYKQPVSIGSRRILYQAVQEGFLVGLTRAISFVDFGCNIGLEWMETNVVSEDLARAINFQPLLADRKIAYAFCEPSIMIDMLDDKLNPRRGTLTGISLKGMFPWQKEAVHFLKILCEQSFFIPIKKRSTYAMRLRFGHIFNQEFQNIMPPERFFLGGQNSLRSYQVDKAPPRGLFIDEDGKERTLQQGGKSLINMNAEFRFPIYGDFGMTVFQDAGVLFQSNEEIKEVIKGGKLLAASGFGIRYHTPIGPLRFDLGFKWKKQDPNETLYAWFLTFGNAF